MDQCKGISHVNISFLKELFCLNGYHLYPCVDPNGSIEMISRMMYTIKTLNITYFPVRITEPELK